MNYFISRWWLQHSYQSNFQSKTGAQYKKIKITEINQYINAKGQQTNKCVPEKHCSLSIIVYNKKLHTFILMIRKDGISRRLLWKTLVLYHAGLPPEASQTNCKVMKVMKHHIKIDFGVSETSYWDTREFVNMDNDKERYPRHQIDIYYYKYYWEY